MNAITAVKKTKKKRIVALSLVSLACFGLTLSAQAQFPQPGERGGFGTPTPLPRVGEKQIGQFPGARPGQPGVSGEQNDPANRNPFGGLGRLLNLTDAQRASAKALIDSHRIAIQSLRDQAKAARELLQIQLREGTDPTTIGNAVLTARSFQEPLREANELLQTSLRNLLTPDQQILLDTLNEFRGEREGRLRERSTRRNVGRGGNGEQRDDQ